MSELGHEMIIELTSNEPIYRKPYRMGMDERVVVKEITTELEKNNVIRASNSSYASSAVPVRKKNGKLRLAVDYRRVNGVTKRIHFPILMIDDQIDKLSGKCVFIVLDLKSGFHQIPMHPDSVKYTAFITPDGHWEFLRMPFGLAYGPAVFQRVLNKVLKEHAFIYMDDILIAARDIDEAFEKFIYTNRFVLMQRIRFYYILTSIFNLKNFL